MMVIIHRDLGVSSNTDAWDSLGRGNRAVRLWRSSALALDVCILWYDRHHESFRERLKSYMTWKFAQYA